MLSNLALLVSQPWLLSLRLPWVLIVEHDFYTKHLVTTNQRFTRDISPSHDPLSFNKNFEEMAIDILRSFCSRKINHFEIALDCRRIGENKAKDKVYYTDVHLVLCVQAFKAPKSRIYY